MPGGLDTRPGYPSLKADERSETSSMKDKRVVKTITAAVLAVTVAGCQQTARVLPAPQCDFRAIKALGPAQGAVLVPLVPGSAEVMPLNAVNITDAAITNKIVTQSTNARREANGDVTVFARLVNCTDYPLQLEARTHFLDAGQIDAEPVTAWTRLHATAHGLVGYTTHSTAGSAVQSYLIEVREGR